MKNLNEVMRVTLATFGIKGCSMTLVRSLIRGLQKVLDRIK